jgi:hypothetical protein
MTKTVSEVLENRENITKETPRGFEVTLKPWLTDNERSKIEEIRDENLDLKAEGQNQDDMTQSANIKGKVVKRMKQERLKQVIVKLNGKEENILERLGKMPTKDAEFIKKETQKIAFPERNKDDKKK